MKPNFAFLRLIAFSAQLTKQLQAQLACNGELSFYDQEKILLSIENPRNISSNYTLYPRDEVLAVRCRNYKSKPWIIGSVSNGIVTDTRWKCTGLAKREPLNFKWLQDRADDGNWAQAVASFSNRGDSPWRKVQDISEDAFWISTANEDDVRIFCRRRLSDVFLKRASFSKGMKYLKSKAPNFFEYGNQFPSTNCQQTSLRSRAKWSVACAWK